MSPPSVLVVSAIAHPRSRGGIERIQAGAMGHLRDRGHRVDELLGEAAGGPLRLFWRDHRWIRPRFPRRTVLAHDRALLREAAAAVDVVTWWGVGGLPLRLLGASGRPELAFVLDAWFRYGPVHDPTYRGSFRWPKTLTPYFISQTVRAAAGVEGAVLTAGIAPVFEVAAPLNAEWTGRVLVPGRVEEPKGVHVAAAALGERLRVVGDGPAEYVERVRAYGASVTGAVGAPALIAEMVAADAVVFPVVWPEPWGLMPLEAMAVGRPVVATGTGGSGEYLRDGENCLLVAPGDVDGLRAAVDRLAAEPVLRERLRAGGLATAAEHPERRFLEGVERAVLSAAR